MILRWLFGIGRKRKPDPLCVLTQRLKELEMKVTELAATLVTLDNQLTKAKAEILGKIAALEASLADVAVPQEAVDALAALTASAAALDDIVPDA